MARTQSNDPPRRVEQPITETPSRGFGAEKNTVEETHPAFGVAVVTRGSGSGRALFQSDLLHNESITLSIHRADRTRDLNSDWVHPREELIEIELSLAQWGSLVSSIGIGSGVPVTIRRTESEHQVPLLPYQPRIRASINEVHENIGKTLARARETFVALKGAIENKGGVRAVREALRAHELSVEYAESNSEFAVKSMVRAAEKVTSQARADIESQILRAATLTGLTASVEMPALTMASDAALAIEAAPHEEVDTVDAEIVPSDDDGVS